MSKTTNRGSKAAAKTVKITVRNSVTGKKYRAFEVSGETFHGFEALARTRGMTWQKLLKTILHDLYIQKLAPKGGAA